jgi:Txe/YoeB family toxin of toxin-antitoxin system
MVKWALVYTAQAEKDARRLSRSGLAEKARELLEVLARNPFQSPPPFEKLTGDLAGLFSRRINFHNRLVYQVWKAERTVKIIRMWTHYE